MSGFLKGSLDDYIDFFLRYMEFVEIISTKFFQLLKIMKFPKYSIVRSYLKSFINF